MATATFGRARAAAMKVAETELPKMEVGVDEVTTTGGLVKPTPPMPVAVSDGAPVAGLEGEWQSRDAVIPFIALGQKTSKLADEHPDWIGQFVYDKAEPLGDTLRIIVTRMRKYYIEATEFGSGEIPQRFSKAVDVRAAGLDPDNSEEVQECVDVDFLVEAKNDEQYERSTIVDEGDRGYYPARFTVRSSALRSFTGIVFRDLTSWLKGDIARGYYKLIATKRVNPKGTFFVPMAKADGELTPDFRAKVKAQFKV